MRSRPKEEYLCRRQGKLYGINPFGHCHTGSAQGGSLYKSLFTFESKPTGALKAVYRGRQEKDDA
jgi:hypothetical protein